MLRLHRKEIGFTHLFDTKRRVFSCFDLKSLPHFLEIQSSDGSSTRVLVLVPGRPPLCLRCNTLGHMSGACTAPVYVSPDSNEILWKSLHNLVLNILVMTLLLQRFFLIQVPLSLKISGPLLFAMIYLLASGLTFLLGINLILFVDIVSVLLTSVLSVWYILGLRLSLNKRLTLFSPQVEVLLLNLLLNLLSFLLLSLLISMGRFFLSVL